MFPSPSLFIRIPTPCSQWCFTFYSLCICLEHWTPWQDRCSSFLSLLPLDSPFLAPSSLLRTSCHLPLWLILSSWGLLWVPWRFWCPDQSLSPTLLLSYLLMISIYMSMILPLPCPLNSLKHFLQCMLSFPWFHFYSIVFASLISNILVSLLHPYFFSLFLALRLLKIFDPPETTNPLSYHFSYVSYFSQSLHIPLKPHSHKLSLLLSIDIDTLLLFSLHHTHLDKLWIKSNCPLIPNLHFHS